MSERARFNAAEYIRNDIKFRGGTNEYLEARWAVAWFRHEWPHAEVHTEPLQVQLGQGGHAFFRATVTLIDADGVVRGRATGHGQELASDFAGDFVEKAETKALRRALNLLGFSKELADPDLATEAEYVAPAEKAHYARPESRQMPTPKSQTAVAARPAASAPAAKPKTAESDWGALGADPQHWTGRAANARMRIDNAVKAGTPFALGELEKWAAGQELPAAIAAYLKLKVSGGTPGALAAGHDADQPPVLDEIPF